MKKTMKKKTKLTPSKIKRGGHAFYYSSLPAICGLGVHDEDCVPSTLYFLGILTYEASVYLAQEVGKSINYLSVLDWLDENFPDDGAHVIAMIMDVRDVYQHTTKRGKNVYNRKLLNARNGRVMAYLHYILPYNQMGVIASCEYYSPNDNQQVTGGHAFCIIKDEVGQIVIIDPQSETYTPLNSVHDIVRFLDNLNAYTMYVCIQESVVDGFHHGNQEEYGPNNYELPPNTLNVERMVSINRGRAYNDSNNESNNEEVRERALWTAPQQRRTQRNAPQRGAQQRGAQQRAYRAQTEKLNFDYPPSGRTNSDGRAYPARYDRAADQWGNDTGYYNGNGWYHYNE